MGSYGIAMSPPAFDDDLGFSKSVKDLVIEQFTSKASIEGFNDAVFLVNADRRDIDLVRGQLDRVAEVGRVI